MNKLRYSSNTEKDQVTVNGYLSQSNLLEALYKAFGIIYPPFADKITFEFFIYKKKPSWIRFHHGKTIEFTYDIVKVKADPNTAQFSMGHDHMGGIDYDYYLTFEVKNCIEKLIIQVNDSCYPKKTLIKHFFKLASFVGS